MIVYSVLNTTVGFISVRLRVTQPTSNFFCGDFCSILSCCKVPSLVGISIHILNCLVLAMIWTTTITHSALTNLFKRSGPSPQSIFCHGRDQIKRWSHLLGGKMGSCPARQTKRHVLALTNVGHISTNFTTNLETVWTRWEILDIDMFQKTCLLFALGKFFRRLCRRCLGVPTYYQTSNPRVWLIPPRLKNGVNKENRKTEWIRKTAVNKDNPGIPPKKESAWFFPDSPK